MSYFIYARKSRKDADLEALGIDVLERISPLCWSLPKRCRFRSGQFIAKSSPATVLIPAR